MTDSQAPLMVGTVSGKLIDINNFKAEDIDIDDVAISLAQQRRYAGHTEKPWTVGQHLIFCTMLADQGGADETHTKAVFLHDIEEAWVQDIIWPIKTSFESQNYEKLCDSVSNVVYEHFNCRGYNPNYVKLIDKIAYVFEQKAFRPRATYDLNLPDEVMERFDWYFNTLKIGIPEDLINMSDNQVADIIGETLTVMLAEKTIGSSISSEVNPKDIEDAIRNEMILK